MTSANLSNPVLVQMATSKLAPAPLFMGRQDVTMKKMLVVRGASLFVVVGSV